MEIVLPVTDNAETILRARYYARDENGRVVEDWPGLCRRVAAAIAPDDPVLRVRFEAVLRERAFLPNTPTLMNAGKPRGTGMLLACFVVPIPDSMEGIFDSLRALALIQKGGGGTGFDLSEMRPEGAPVRGYPGAASGPLSFIRLHDLATEVVKQGITRRGANMGTMLCTHPDIEKFITCKDAGNQRLTNFNLSVLVTDEFMHAVRSDGTILLRHERAPGMERAVRARELWEKICVHAWMTGDPGLIFIDRVNAANPIPHVGRIQATNPCGEVPLLPWEACVLGSINLNRTVWNDGGVWRFDWQRFEELARLAVRFLDRVIDATTYPLPEIERVQRYGNRKIGVGLMGFADVLVKLGIPYDSDAALRFAQRLAETLRSATHDESRKLADEVGPYPNYAPGISPYRRNACTMAIAPTGTISIIADASGGIEPWFAAAYARKTSEGFVLFETARCLRDLLGHRVDFDALVRTIVENNGSVRGVPGMPPEIAEVFPIAREIGPDWHVRVQAAFQTGIDQSISKTINLPSTASVADVDRAFQLAYDLGCKSITVFRDGCKEGHQVLSTEALASAMANGTASGIASPARTEWTCPDCGGHNLLFEHRCQKCADCGWSACSI